MIVFDLDDTLYKERDFVASGQRHVMQMLRRDHPGMTDEQLAAIVWGEKELAAYRSHKPDIALAPDVADTLEALTLAGHELAIITDGRSVTQRNKIEALGLGRRFDPAHIYISQEVGADKTSAVPFLKAMADNPGETQWVYVADNPAKDFLHPNILGWDTVMLVDTEGVNVHTQTLPADPLMRPKATIKRLDELLQKFS